MTINTKAASGCDGAAFENSSAGQRIEFSKSILTQSQSAPPQKNASTSTLNAPMCACWPCPHEAVASHVTKIGGPQLRLCRRHWLMARKQGFVEVVCREPDALFAVRSPRAQIGRGGTVTDWRISLIGATARRAA